MAQGGPAAPDGALGSSGGGPTLRRPGFGLSVRVLALVVAAVLTAEVLVFLPSIARFRLAYLQELIENGALASLALDATPDNMIDEALTKTLLGHARVDAVTVIEPGKPSRVLAPSMPPEVRGSYELYDVSVPELVGDALAAMARDGPRLVRVGGPSMRMPQARVSIVVDEEPLRVAMYAYAWRILALSLMIAAFTAGFLWLALRWLIVRPVQRISADMTAFRRAPEDAATRRSPVRRNDEIGIVDREFDLLQRELRAALRQKTRLAELGSAISKINHDMRNMLTTAQLLSDQLARSDDPKVRRVAPLMLGAIDRAVRLAGDTLDWARGRPAPRAAPFDLADLVDEVGVALLEQGDMAEPDRPRDWRSRLLPGFEIVADRDLLYRVFANLGRNAYEAGARGITVDARREGGAVTVEIADDGPGVPAQIVDGLFRPFAQSTRAGGSGLGLAIARDLVRAHGGDIGLAANGPAGAVFRLTLPGRPPRA